MTTTDPTVDEQRAAAIAGLHELADFLTEHPALKAPHVYLPSGYLDVRSLVEWIDGLTEIRIEPGSIPSYRKVVRTFAGLDVSMSVDAKILGEVREVPTVAEEFTPFTADEIRQRAAVTA